MTTTPTGDATVAAVFRATLALGIATPADLVPWADGQVLARPSPPAWVIDLSLSAAEPWVRVDDLLRDPSAGADPAVVFGLIVGLTEANGPWTSAEAERAASWLWTTAHRFVDVEDRLMASTAIAWVDEMPWSGVARVAAGVRDCFAAYADPAARAWLPTVRVRFASER